MSLSPEEKKLDKLNKLFELVNEEYATPDDLVMLSETILSIITAEKERLAGVIASEKKDDKQEKAEMLVLLNEKEQALKQIITRLTYQTEQSISQVDTKLSKTLSSEIKRLERKIPTKTDLTGLEGDIQALREGLNSLPTEFTINNEAVRDGLELLQGDQRLDKSAIKGLDDWEEIARLAREPRQIGNAGVKLLRYLSDVNIEGITNGQTLVWSDTLQRFEPGTAGGGSGSGDVVGPASATDNAIARYDGTTGKLIQNSSATIADDGTLNATSVSAGGSAFTSININGTNGNGHVHLKHQASDPSSQASSSTIFADSNGNLAWLNDGLSKITIDGDGVTAARSYTLPDASGTVALTVQANDIEITDTTKGIILKSADGTRWRIGITNGGALTAVSL